jgi:hypothetical protein
MEQLTIKGLPERVCTGHGLPPAGKEAYSAIAFKGSRKYRKHRNLTLQIFATDLDTDAIEKRHRFFTSNIVVDVSPEKSVLQYRSRWLSREFKHTNAYFAPLMSSKTLLLAKYSDVAIC